jgi:hypothetical protein
MPEQLAIVVQDYSKGVNRDLNSESVTPGTIFDCQNFRIFVDKTNGQQGLNNVKGTKVVVDLVDTISHSIPVIIGACNIRDLIVLFLTDNTTDAGGQGWIVTFSIDKVTHTLKTPVTIKYYNPDLLFTTKHPIEAHGHYENDNKQFIYFSDYYQETRCANLATIQLSDPVESLGMFMNVSLPKPVITTIETGGSLPVGIYEITAFFNTIDGKKSLYCPNSNQVHIVEDLESEPTGNSYDGSSSLTTNGDTIFTSKAIRASIDLSTIPSGLFTSVTFISVFKSQVEQVPVITNIETVQIGSNTTVNFLYTNNEDSSFDIPYEEYLINQHPFFTNKTFSILKSQLSVSNVKSSKFDLEWDTETVRWNGDTLRKQNNFEYTGDIYNNPYNDESGKANGFRPAGTFDDWHNLDQFLYQSNQTIVGGESLDGSIKYRFTLESIKGDTSNYLYDCYVNNSGQQTYTISGNNLVNPYFPDYNSPILRTLRQFKRGEVYRMGLVGFKNGRSSFVKIIGDIKFPDISTPAGHLLAESLAVPQSTFVTASFQPDNFTYLHPLGIEFTITIPTTVDVDYIQLVRVPRTDADKTRIAQGVISKFFQSRDASNNLTGIYLSMSDINDVEQYYASGTQPNQTVGANQFIWQNRQSVVDSKEIISFFTPEASFEYLYPEKKNEDYLKVVGLVTNTIKDNRIGSDTPLSVLPGGEGWGGNIVKSSGGFYTPLTGNSTERRLLYTKGRSTAPVPQYTKSFHREKVKALKLVNGFFGDDNSPDTFDGVAIRNYSFDNSNPQGTSVANGQGAYSGTCLLCRLESATITDPFENIPYVYKNPSITTAPWSPYRYKAFLVDYTRLVDEQYGGINPNQFEFNEFIPISDPIYASGTYRIFEGDTFITMFNFMKNFWDSSLDNDSFYESVVFPVETNINTELNLGKTFLQGTGGYDHNSDGNYESYRAQEAGNRNGNMFGYNPIFSNWLINRPYFSKPTVLVENLTYDVRTYLSLNKIIGEELNSWCRFPLNSFNDVIASYGPINRTHYFLNQLFFLQDFAVGYISVNPRAIVGTTDGVPTELGSAEGLHDFYYISTANGSIHQKGSLVIDQMMYFYDGINRKFLSLHGKGKEDLSEILGMDSWFRQLDGYTLYDKLEGGDNPIEGKGVHLAYDNENKEIYITVMGNYYPTEITELIDQEFQPGDIISYNNIIYVLTDDINPSDYIRAKEGGFLEALLSKSTILNPSDYNYTLVYSTLYKNFRESIRDHKPPIYFTDSNFIFSPNLEEIHLHNYGNPCEFYGTVYPSSITFITNDKPINNKILGWMEYSITVKDQADNFIQNEGLDSIQITNDYQDTGTVSLTGRQKQRFRKWRIKVPRDTNSNNSLARVRGDWFKTKLTYNNSLNRNINLERIEVVYQPQNY